jgi:hypothetical protein
LRQVITTPYGTSFDQLRAADEVQYKFDRCCRAMAVRFSGVALLCLFCHTYQGHTLNSQQTHTQQAH